MKPNPHTSSAAAARATRTRRSVGFALFFLSLPVLVVPTVAVPARAAAPDPDARAKELFHLGEAHFAAGRYRQAAAAYESAYAAKRLPAFLFNIGQCYRNLDRPGRALTYFKAYLLDAPHAANRAAVLKAIEDLQVLLAKEQSQPKKEEAPIPAPGTSPPGVSGTVGETDRPRGESSPPGADEVRPVLPQLSDPLGSSAAVPPDGGDAGALSTPVYRRWWFWTLIGAAVAGGTVAGILLGRSATTSSSIGEAHVHAFGGAP